VPQGFHRFRLLAWTMIITTFVGAFGVAVAVGPASAESVEATVVHIVTRTMAAVGAAVVLVSLLWHAVPQPSASTDNVDGAAAAEHAPGEVRRDRS
jgi:Na+/citrate or Na+/malate symporter